jgi:polar amino acid transport system substrate-binding protein
MKYAVYLSLVLSTSLLASCSQQEPKVSGELHFSTSAEYPPFEYLDHGELKGFDIELAKLVAQELHMKPIFDNMQFSTVLPAVATGKDDAAIATLTITEARKKNFDFSIPYYYEGMAAVYKNNNPVNTVSALQGKKLSAQLGSVMDLWLKEYAPKEQITTFDNNIQAIEALDAGNVDMVLMDKVQAEVFSQKHPGFAYAMLAEAKVGYGIAVQKGSPLTVEVNRALQQLKAKGAIDKLKAQWLENIAWKK